MGRSILGFLLLAGGLSLANKGWGFNGGGLMVEPDKFCQRVVGFSAGSLSEAARVAVIQDEVEKNAKLTQALLQAWRSDGVTHLALNQKLLGESIGFEDRYISVDRALSVAMGLPADTIALRGVDQLRHLPQALRGSHLVIIADDASSLTKKRLTRVGKVADAKGIHLSFLWTGGIHQMAHENALRLAFLAGKTGGQFFDINLITDQCKSQRS